MGFGKILGQKLEEKNIKQIDLAAGIGISRSTLNGIITRDTSKVEIETFLKICQYLKCDPEEFYDEYVQDGRPTNYNAASALTPAQTQIVRLYEKLTIEQQYILIGRAEQMVADNEAQCQKQDTG